MMNDSSSPSSASSRRTRLPPGPSSFFSITRSTKSFAAAKSGARKTPLPAHNPSALITTGQGDRKSTRLNSSHDQISYAVFCLKKKTNKQEILLYNKKSAYPADQLI